MREFLRKGGWGIIGMVLLFLGISYGVYRFNQADYDRFKQADIKGVLLSLTTQNHGFAVVFSLSDNQRYRFFPSKRQGGTSGFMARAAPGDSVRKKPLSDTLLLIKQGSRGRQLIPYTFDRVLY